MCSCSESSKNMTFTVLMRLNFYLKKNWKKKLILSLLWMGLFTFTFTQHDGRVKFPLVLNLAHAHACHLFVPLPQWAEAGLPGPNGQSAMLSVGGAGRGVLAAAPIRPPWMEEPSARARPSSGWPAPHCVQVTHLSTLFHALKPQRHQDVSLLKLPILI